MDILRNKPTECNGHTTHIHSLPRTCTRAHSLLPVEWQPWTAVLALLALISTSPYTFLRLLYTVPATARIWISIGLGFKSTLGFASGVNGGVNDLMSDPLVWLCNVDEAQQGRNSCP